MYNLIKKIFFKYDPEEIHHVVFSWLRFINNVPFVPSILNYRYANNQKSLEREVFGLKFKNPVGLAAGFDKNADTFNSLANLGFGFIEIGTVTPLAQDGNPKPRIFRLVDDNALINRMGFNNYGADQIVENLKKRQNKDVLIGGNIGKNKNTPNESADQDYIICFNKLFDYVDYFTINVSSPNTPNLRALQDKEPLTNLLRTLQNLNNQKDKPKPILLKIAPDLTDSQLDDIIEIVKETKIAGVVATNTTLDRSNLVSSNDLVSQTGGLSGVPVRKRSTEIIKYLHQKSNGAFPIIGVGGIHSADDAIEKLNAGASLIQIYTGFVYEGPALIKKINNALLNKK